MTQARLNKRRQIFFQKAATGIGTDVEEKGQDFMIVTGFRHVTVTFVGETSAALTVKCQGANFESDGSQPDFSAAASVTNQFVNLEMINKADQSDLLTGALGKVYGGSDDGVTQYAINVDQIDVINFDITAYTTGELTAEATATTDA